MPRIRLLVAAMAVSCGGGGGIRTHEGFSHPTRFRDGRTRPGYATPPANLLGPVRPERQSITTRWPIRLAKLTRLQAQLPLQLVKRDILTACDFGFRPLDLRA